MILGIFFIVISIVGFALAIEYVYNDIKDVKRIIKKTKKK